MMLARCYAAGVALSLVLFLMTALEAPPGARVALAQDAKAEKKADEKKVEKKAEKIKPYDEVITKEAKSSPGLFLVHRIEDKVFFEIPIAALGKEMLWVTQIERTPSDGYGYGGSPVGDRVVRWEQRGDDILLRDVKYEIRADVKDPIRDAVEADVARARSSRSSRSRRTARTSAGHRRDRPFQRATCPSSARRAGWMPRGSIPSGRSSRRSRRSPRTSRPRCC